MKIISWNVNGLQSILKRDVNGNKYKTIKAARDAGEGVLDTLINNEDPDFICLQEIRCSAETCDHTQYLPFNYQYVNYARKRGYSGVLIATKLHPLNVIYNYGVDEDKSRNGFNDEGRMITLEYDDFYLVNVYTPNSGTRGLQRLSWRVNEWDSTFRNWVGTLTKNTIIVGDFNVIHTELDSYKDPIPRIAGGTRDERDSFTKLLNDGFHDTFRLIYPETRKYSWTYSNTNLGYRLDYALVNGDFEIYDSTILDYTGSDHLPVSISLNTK